MYFIHEERRALEVHILAALVDGDVEDLVVGGGQLDPGEEIGRDAVEERQVMVEELGQVDVDDGPQHQDILILLRIF